MFEDWIGYCCATKIYSWSTSDLIQLEDECGAKGMALPENMCDWVDFQEVYPQVMEFDSDYRQMSLQTAAEQFGILMDKQSSHTALYDAEITAELVVRVLTGEYKRQAEVLRKIMRREEDEHGFKLGDSCDGVLQQLLRQMQSKEELALA